MFLNGYWGDGHRSLKTFGKGVSNVRITLGAPHNKNKDLYLSDSKIGRDADSSAEVRKRACLVDLRFSPQLQL